LKQHLQRQFAGFAAGAHGGSVVRQRSLVAGFRSSAKAYNEQVQFTGR